MSEKATQVGAFDALLGELDTLTKALPADDGSDKKIQAAAEGGGSVDGDEDENLDADGKPILGKSLQVTLADGTKVDAQDGTALVKSLIGRIDDTEDVISKCLTAVVGMVKAQDELIKSLQGDVKRLGGEGKGRKTMLAITEQASTLAKSAPTGLDVGEFMIKANSAFDAKRINGKELTFIDVAIRNGQANVIDQSLVTKVLAA